nr:hypothetical protein [Tanacetum cinerariifolium]
VLLSVLVSRNKLYCGEHLIIPGKVSMYLVSPLDGLILSHEEIDDNLGETRIVHLITLFGILVLYLINKILPHKAHVDDCNKRSPWLMQFVDVDICDHLYLTTVTKFSKKCEDCLFKKHKDAKKSNEMYYPRFTKVIVNFFMTKDQSIQRRNKEYYAIALGAKHPKTKASVRKKQSSSDPTMPPLTAKGKRLKFFAKLDKPAKEKQPAKKYKAKGLTVQYEVSLTESKQMKLATKQSQTQTHISYASGSGEDEGTGIIPGVPDVPTYESDDDEISWKTMDITIDQQVALDDALVPHAGQLRIGKSKFRLRLDLKSKELTLQVVYDVLKLTPFYKAFLVTSDVLEIYMQEFWETAIVHHHSIHFKMNNKKHIVNL